MRTLLVTALLALAPGCGAWRFHDAWSDFEPSAGASGMEGRWKGEWRSEWNGHSGGLRCLMTPGQDGRFDAWFFATFAAILFFQYETEFTVVADEGGVQTFEGEQDLGKTAGGLYRYRGTVVGDEFRATFEAANGDHGVFELRRVD